MQNKKIIVICVVNCLIIGTLSFIGGVSYGKSKIKNTFSNRQGSFQNGIGVGAGNRMGGQRMGGGTGMGGFISGEIISKDDKSMTLKLRDGGSKIVLFSTTSKVEKTVDGLISDIEIGKSVMVTGTPNGDGSVSAVSIQMRPNILPVTKTN